MNRTLLPSLIVAVIAIASLPAHAAEPSFAARGRIVTLPTIEVHPSAEQRAELATIRAIRQRIVTLDTVEVRPTAEQWAQYARRGRASQSKSAGKSKLRYSAISVAAN